MSGMLESSSDDGCMSDHSFDFVEVEGGTSYSSDGDATVTSSLAPPKGWSTLSLSDAEAVKTGPAAVTTTTTTTGAAGGRREFISTPIAAASFCQTAAAVTKSSTRFEPSSLAAFSCRACGNLLRDCVECPTCHSLFCREHLVVDKQNGTSPCPCEPCSLAPIATTLSAASTSSPAAAARAHHHPREAFLPNIPLQRIADAVPSRCDGCGISLSWGELGRHACDQQLVPCGRRQHGCSWFGKRHEREAHEASSTCPGRLALAQAEALEARSEAARLRAAGEEAERRASSAEMRASELEARLAAAERCLQERDQEAAALRGKITTMTAAAAVTAEENGKKQERLQQQLKQQAAAAAAAVAQDARRAGKHQQQQAAATRTPQPPPQQQQQPPNAMPFAAILNRAGFSPQTATTTAAAAAAPVRLPLAVPDRKKSGAGSRAAAIATTQTVVPSTASRASGRGTAKGTLSAAVQMARAGGSPPRASAGVMMDTASQAPVPAVEACLKPYLERPSSLLEKKVVVFWPRQGRWYTGRPTVYKEATREHRVEYDDGDVRDHVLAHRSWGLIG
ncbi:hypothetical protein Esi_0117_0068 [Ectocarpus siliculosus]|uniref:Uncharacterized protein n=1 Tax=Ectocarpus siliculosus TaxID=2880 RepID=D7FI56_ECTSI|nr:hypothetical protein Esi_0117_0068 [Ectocarpus siliculosus]|eukprot:CBJ28682.1 hypothetical protein Esi_0117_0068 [Ectocarpus siliculosus]